jgi:hypothetical protein
MQAEPLHKYLGDIKTGAGLVGYRDLKYRLGNIAFAYNLQFTEENLEILFSNDVELLSKYLDDLEQYKYSLNDGQTWLSIPEDIGEFIYHCHKHWYIIPEWDENLIKRDFKIWQYAS